MSRRVLRYSEAFKRQVVLELEDGTVSSVEEVRRKYGISGGETVVRWIRKFGRNHLLSKVVRVETPEERTEVQKLKARLRQLEKALADADIRSLLNQAHFEIACEQMGVDIEVKKKEIDMKLSAEQSD